MKQVSPGFPLAVVGGKLVGLVEEQLAVAGDEHVWVQGLLRAVFVLVVVLELVPGGVQVLCGMEHYFE